MQTVFWTEEKIASEENRISNMKIVAFGRKVIGRQERPVLVAIAWTIGITALFALAVLGFYQILPMPERDDIGLLLRCIERFGADMCRAALN